MPKRNWEAVDEPTSGGINRPPAGGYVAAIISVDYNPVKESCAMVFDIVEDPSNNGQFVGYYSSEYGAAHPATHRFYLNYSERALGITKSALKAFTLSNAGFDATAASDADQFQLFVGKRIGINLREEEWLGDDGDIRTSLKVCQYVDAAEVRAGKVKPWKVKALKQEQQQAPVSMAAAIAASNTATIPFS